MKIQVNVQGYFDMTFLNVHTDEQIKEEDILQGILDNLQQGEYIIGFASRFVYDINDLQNPLYKFELEVTDSVEYDFDEE